eukprot:jgi/Mesen1/1372/ME000013S00861
MRTQGRKPRHPPNVPHHPTTDLQRDFRDLNREKIRKGVALDGCGEGRRKLGVERGGGERRKEGGERGGAYNAGLQGAGEADSRAVAGMQAGMQADKQATGAREWAGTKESGVGGTHPRRCRKRGLLDGHVDNLRGDGDEARLKKTEEEAATRGPASARKRGPRLLARKGFLSIVNVASSQQAPLANRPVCQERATPDTWRALPTSRRRARVRVIRSRRTYMRARKHGPAGSGLRQKIQRQVRQDKTVGGAEGGEGQLLLCDSTGQLEQDRVLTWLPMEAALLISAISAAHLTHRSSCVMTRGGCSLQCLEACASRAEKAVAAPLGGPVSRKTGVRVGGKKKLFTADLVQLVQGEGPAEAQLVFGCSCRAQRYEDSDVAFGIYSSTLGPDHQHAARWHPLERCRSPGGEEGCWHSWEELAGCEDLHTARWPGGDKIAAVLSILELGLPRLGSENQVGVQGRTYRCCGQQGRSVEFEA